MKKASYQFDAVGLTTLTFGRMFSSVRDNNEGADAFDERCWKERCHALQDGRVIWPVQAFKLLAESAAKMRGDKVPGKKSSTFTSRFRTGLLIDPTADPTVVFYNGEPVTLDTIEGRVISVPSDGMRGGTKRVPRRFPEIDPPWRIHVSLLVVDADLIEHPTILDQCFETGGFQIGIGVNRPERNGGDHGLFSIENRKFEVIK